MVERELVGRVLFDQTACCDDTLAIGVGLRNK